MLLGYGAQVAPPMPGPFSPYLPAYPTMPYHHLPPSTPYYPRPQNRRVSPSRFLSDWLPSLDHGERGCFGDQFGLLVSGFADVAIVRLSHLRDYTPYELTQISFYTPDGMPHRLEIEAARRLMAYVHEDQPLIDPVDKEKGGVQPTAGSSKLD